jgi:hypothetical protein
MNTIQDREVYIEVWSGRVVIGCTSGTRADYTAMRALNWRALEPEARVALRSMETPMSALVYPCPPQLANKAIFSAVDEDDWITLPQASRLSGLAIRELHLAISRGYLEMRTIRNDDGKRKSINMVRRSQVAEVWSFDLNKKLECLRGEFGTLQDKVFNVRFWTKVDIGNRDACWPWQAGKSSAGYGIFWMHGRSKLAHRVAYEMIGGALDNNTQVHHTCNNLSCVNPLHLTLLKNDIPSA